MPNLKTLRIKSDLLGREFSLKVSVKTERTIAKCGGFDDFLLSRPGNPAGSNRAASKQLTVLGLSIRRALKRKLKNKVEENIETDSTSVKE